MFRGTTPTITFSVNSTLDLTTITDVYITMTSKHGDKVREFTIDDVTVDAVESKIYLSLTQEDTLYFEGGKTVRIQLRLKDADGNAYASNIIENRFDDILKDGEI